MTLVSDDTYGNDDGDEEDEEDEVNEEDEEDEEVEEEEDDEENEEDDEDEEDEVKSVLVDGVFPRSCGKAITAPSGNLCPSLVDDQK